MTGTDDVRELRYEVYANSEIRQTGVPRPKFRPAFLAAAIRLGRRHGLSWWQLALGWWTWADLMFAPGRAVMWVGERIVDLGERIAHEYDPRLRSRDAYYLLGDADGIDGAISLIENENFSQEETVDLLRRLTNRP